MAATRAESRAREIFATLEYGPAPESHACALVRACGPALPLPPPPARVLRADSRDPPRQLRDPPFFAAVIPGAPGPDSRELLRLCPSAL